MDVGTFRESLITFEYVNLLQLISSVHSPVEISFEAIGFPGLSSDIGLLV
jgi:hypothetical protein